MNHKQSGRREVTKGEQLLTKRNVKPREPVGRETAWAKTNNLA